MNEEVELGIIKRPLLRAFIFVLIIAASLTVWFVTINLLEIETTYNNTLYLLTHAFAVTISMTIGIVLIRKQKWNLAYVGVRKIEKNTLKSVFYTVPLYVILLLPLLAVGLNGIEYQADTLNIATFVILFHLTVVIHEEFYFRGIILSLFKHNLKKAVLISAFLFGVMHFLNLFQVLFDNEIIFSGFFVSTLIQVARTFGFGLIFAVIVIKTKSLIPVVLFHWIGNSFARIVNIPSEFVLIQSVLYTIYGIVLLVVLFKKPN